MTTQLGRLQALARNDDGVTALEYALIASVIVVMISAFVPDIMQALTTTWTNISTALS